MLQKLALVTTALLLNIALYAQLQKGDKMVGASVGTLFYNNTTSDLSNTLGSSSTGTDNFGITVSPSIGWFIAEDVAIGFAPSLSYNKQKQVGKSSTGSTYLKDESSRFDFALGGFARYYFKGANENLRFFGQYNLSVGFGGSKTEGFEYETLGLYVDRYDRKSSGDFVANTGINLGLSKFFGNHTSLDVYVGYNYSYLKTNPKGNFLRDYTDPGTGDITQKVDYDQKITTHNIVLGVGFQIFLPKKK